MHTFASSEGTIVTRIRHSVTAAATAVLLAPGVATASTTDSPDDAQLLLLLDSSGSMEDPDAEGEPKIDAAKAAVGTLVDGLNPDQQVGVRLFGGSVPLDEPREDKCTDSELVVPLGSGNTDAMRDAVEAYQPLGETPIAYALQQAADDLGEEGNRTILLVSDGIATCDPDPCEVAEELTADGFDLVVHTVGLGVDQETRDQLECVADVAGGTYYDADDTDSLTTALTRISTRAFRPFQLSGEPVQGTENPNDAPVIGTGQYLDTVADRRKTYYLVERSSPGTSLHVGATMRPTENVGLSAFYLSLETLDGKRCDFNTAMTWGNAGGNNFGTVDVTGFADHHDPDDPCGFDDQLLLSINEQQTSTLDGFPVELWVSEEPAATRTDLLPYDLDHDEWQGTRVGDPDGEVVGGTSFNDAEPIEPGRTYEGEIVEGEVLVFSVPVDWGQHVEALVDFPDPPEELYDYLRRTRIAEIGLVGPDRGDALHNLGQPDGYDRRAKVQPDERTTFAALSYDVEWNNRAWGNPNAADRAGDHYVVVSLTSGDEPGATPPIPFTLTVDVLGEVDGEPTYLEAGEQPAAATQEARSSSEAGADQSDDESSAEADPTEDASAAAPAEGGDARLLTLIWVLAGLGLVVALVGGYLLVRGRRFST